MEWIYGVSECWSLSRSCRIDWDAWSAIGAAAAVFVALLVGVLPVWSHYRNGRARGRVKGRVFLAQLDLAAFWIEVGHEVARLRPHEENHYNAAIGFALNCRRVDVSVVLPEIEFLPRDVADLIGTFAVKCIEFERTVCGNDGEPMHAPEEFLMVPSGHREVELVLHITRALQSRMHAWLFPDLPPPPTDAWRRTADRVHAELEQP